MTNENFICRPLFEAEIPAALALVRSVFAAYEAPVYPPEGTAEFERSLQSESYLNGIGYYGAFDDENLVGVLGIRRACAHICFFFVEGSYQRRGIGRKLFCLLMKDYKGKTITLNSSPYGLPFYKALGFVPVSEEQTVNGIRFTPMILQGEEPFSIVKLSARRDLKDRAAAWFASKWSIPQEVYAASIEASFCAEVPAWYLCLSGEKIVGGMGVIANDFHPRKNLSPNICAVYTEPEFRGQGVAKKLLRFVCEDMKEKGIDTLYLLTDLEGFYERCGFTYLCPVTAEGEESPSRMYVHKE